MTVIDYLIIAIVVISMLYGLMRGFFKEVISLSALIVGVWAGFTYAAKVAPMIPSLPFLGESDFFSDASSRQRALAGFLIFLSCILLGALINFIVNKLSEKSGLSGFNRLLGMLFGFARGAVFVSVAALIIQNFSILNDDPTWQNAKLRTYAERGASFLEDTLPEEVLAYLPGRDESYGKLSGVQTQELFALMQKNGIDLSTADLTQMNIENIDLSGLDKEKLDPEKAKEYLQQLQRQQKKAAD